MNPLFFVIILLNLSFVTAVKFTQVFEWPAGLDYVWPSEANRTQAVKDEDNNPKDVYPLYMAVFGTRIFLSLQKSTGIPASLVSLPTRSVSSSSPKLTPFPSWDMHMHDVQHEYGDCNQIEQVTGLEVDSVGRLWVLDHVGIYCNSKLMIFDLSNNDKIQLIHHFPFRNYLHDLVLDETPNGYFSYFAWWGEQQIVVFSLKRNQSCRTLNMPEMKVISIALSPAKDEEPRQLYFSNEYTSELYSIPVAVLRNGTLTESPKLIGKWTADPYRMLMDNHGTIYAAFLYQNYTSSWNTSQPFEEQRFHEVGMLHTNRRPFSFSLDSSGIFWMTEICKTARSPMPSFRLLKATVGVKPNIIDDSTTTEKRQTDDSALISFLAFFLVLSCTFSLWLSLRMRN